MTEVKSKSRWKKRIGGALWGALLGALLGTAASSALQPVVKTPWLKGLLTEGVNVGISELDTTLGFFSLKLGFSFRFTLLSAALMLTIAALMLFLPFRDP
jgi:hypothetical protein